jgi:hypothetical protein
MSNMLKDVHGLQRSETMLVLVRLYNIMRCRVFTVRQIVRYREQETRMQQVGRHLLQAGFLLG